MNQTYIHAILLHKSKKTFTNFKESVKLKMNTKVKSIGFLEQWFFRLLETIRSQQKSSDRSFDTKILKYRKPQIERGKARDSFSLTEKVRKEIQTVLGMQKFSITQFHNRWLDNKRTLSDIIVRTRKKRKKIWSYLVDFMY